MLSHDRLVMLVDQSRWDEIVSLTANITNLRSPDHGFFFFRGMALTALGRAGEAIPVIQRGLSLDWNSGWGQKLLFDAYRANNQPTEAFEGFARFIESGDDHESEKSWYVQCASELGLFDLAAEMNEKRDVIRDMPAMPKFALALQCFCKADTLEQVFESLVALDSAKTFALVILQDSNFLSSYSERYAAGHDKVKDTIGKWYARLASAFFSVEYLENPRNLGTAPTCRRLLDYVSAKHEGFLFIEDDCILSSSALDWVTYHLNTNVSMDSRWFVSCESIYFDKEDRPLNTETRLRLETLARSPSLKSAFSLLNFVPSTCFATLSPIWRICAGVRSFTRGDESLNLFMQAHGKKTIAPVVPHASDIGMLHELGYSVANVGVTNVRERKGTYLLAEGPFESEYCQPYTGNPDILFAATSKLVETLIGLLEKELGIPSPDPSGIGK